MTRWNRLLASLIIMLALSVGIAPKHVRAQANSDQFAGTNEEETKSEGRVWDGYFAVGILTFFVLFIVAKSARR